MSRSRHAGLRIGQGVDVHRFSHDPHRPLVLGGVHIPDSPGLVGHSDADVLTHAVADALLGAAGLGDLGHHFPDTDSRWAGADSLDLLDRVVTLLAEEGWYAINADCTLVAEHPRLAPYSATMGGRLGVRLDAPVSVKATSGEGLGCLGRGEGIACLAVVLLSDEPRGEA
jgi:2-C-methyl-D-erythritol 2,4-cyclodiphosphate synthase